MWYPSEPASICPLSAVLPKRCTEIRDWCNFSPGEIVSGRLNGGCCVLSVRWHHFLKNMAGSSWGRTSKRRCALHSDTGVFQAFPTYFKGRILAFKTGLTPERRYAGGGGWQVSPDSSTSFLACSNLSPFTSTFLAPFGTKSEPKWVRRKGRSGAI